MANFLQRYRNENQADPFRYMDEWMKQAFGSRWGMLPETRMEGLNPRFDIKENHEGYVIKADLPGMKESDVEVTFQGRQLRISGKREAEREEKGDTWHTTEREYGTFTRVMTLPDMANTDKARADLKDGVLQVFVPRDPQAATKKIEVKTNR